MTNSLSLRGACPAARCCPLGGARPALRPRHLHHSPAPACHRLSASAGQWAPSLASAGSLIASTALGTASRALHSGVVVRSAPDPGPPSHPGHGGPSRPGPDSNASGRGRGRQGGAGAARGHRARAGGRGVDQAAAVGAGSQGHEHLHPAGGGGGRAGAVGPTRPARGTWGSCRNMYGRGRSSGRMSGTTTSSSGRSTKPAR